MATGMWPSVSGAVARSQAVDITANNLANVDTPGFKKDVPTFKEYVTRYEVIPELVGAPMRPVKDKDLYPLDGKDQAFVTVDGTFTNFRQGNLRVTQRPYDLAIDGPGFFEVSTPNGVRYTRQGSLRLAMDGQLVTSDGYPVLASSAVGLATAPPLNAVQPSQGGLATQGGVAAGQVSPEIAQRLINLRDRGTNISVSEQGEVYAGDELVARLAVTEFTDKNKLRKQGAHLFFNTDAGNIANNPLKKSKVMQGVIETSNVNPVEEMTNLIKANRYFEHDMKALRTYSELLGREATDVGKL